MKAFLLVFSILSFNTFAGYDHQVGEIQVNLLTRDGHPVPNIIFSYQYKIFDIYRSGSWWLSRIEREDDKFVDQQYLKTDHNGSIRVGARKYQKDLADNSRLSIRHAAIYFPECGKNVAFRINHGESNYQYAADYTAPQGSELLSIKKRGDGDVDSCTIVTSRSKKNRVLNCRLNFSQSHLNAFKRQVRAGRRCLYEGGTSTPYDPASLPSKI